MEKFSIEQIKQDAVNYWHGVTNRLIKDAMFDYINSYGAADQNCIVITTTVGKTQVPDYRTFKIDQKALLKKCVTIIDSRTALIADDLASQCDIDYDRLLPVTDMAGDQDVFRRLKAARKKAISVHKRHRKIFPQHLKTWKELKTT